MVLVPRKNPLLVKNKKDPVVDPEQLAIPFSISGKVPTSREIRKFMRQETASEALGRLYPGCAIFGMTKGQFSLIELIVAVLDQAGPADLFISTWTAAGTDLTEAFELLKSGKMTSCRFLVDHTFQRRKPAFAAKIRELFGADAVRVTRNHAKFCLIRNNSWDLVLKTSMNLNTNPRLEVFDIQDDHKMADYLEALMDDIFSRRKKSDINDPSRLNERRFKKL